METLRPVVEGFDSAIESKAEIELEVSPETSKGRMSAVLKRRNLNNENHGDTSIAKRLCLDDSNSDEKIQRKKQPALNREILNEIFFKLINAKYSYPLNTTKIIEKFALSGLELFKVIQNYFKRIEKVWCASKEIWIYPLKSSKDLYHEISYNSLLLKPILKAMETSIKEVEITLNSEEQKFHMIFEALINEGVERVCIYGKLSKKHFNQLCDITSITNLTCSLLISELHLIQSKCSKLFLQKMKFKDLMMIKENFQKQPKIYLPLVKELSIYRDIEIPEITQESFQYLIKWISEIFPNIQTLDLYFRNRDLSWHNAYAKMKDIQPEWFKGLPLSVKGEISFFSNGSDISYENFCKFREQEDECLVDLYIAAKKFQIHEGFDFEFVLRE